MTLQRKGIQKSGVPAKGEAKEKQRLTPQTENIDEPTESREINLAEVKVFVTFAQVLFDSGDIPAVMTIAMCNTFHAQKVPPSSVLQWFTTRKES